MIGGRRPRHPSTDDDHIGVRWDCLCGPMPDQWVIPRTLEPKRESRLRMRESNSRSIYDRMHLDGAGKVPGCDRDGSSANGRLQVGQPGLLLIGTVLGWTGVDY